MQEPGGRWSVIRDGTVVASGLTNAEAWKRADRLLEDVTSPAEKRTDYWWRKVAAGE